LPPPPPPKPASVDIVDFLPASDRAAGGAKLLICTSAPLDTAAAAAGGDTAGLLVMFGEAAVPAEVLTPTVVRCMAPPFGAAGGSVPLRIAVGPALRPTLLSGAATPPRFEYHPRTPP
ncbi:unnamed protein product, partial [Phaeothamnion confervicola]